MPVGLYGCETRPIYIYIYIRQYNSQRVSENCKLRTAGGPKEEVTEEWKKYIMRSFMISTFYKTWSNKLKEVEMGGACGTHGGEEIYIYIGFWWGKLKERGQLEDL